MKVREMPGEQVPFVLMYFNSRNNSSCIPRMCLKLSKSNSESLLSAPELPAPATISHFGEGKRHASSSSGHTWLNFSKRVAESHVLHGYHLDLAFLTWIPT